MDLFESKDIKPMLIGAEGEPFDSPDYLYELKLDGERCIAYLNESVTELRNKRNVKMLLKVPELADIYKQIKKSCILDGELIVIKDGKPDFFEIQRRSLTSNKFKIERMSKQSPATFTAFDILYYDGEQLTGKTLTERKRILETAFTENERLALSRYIEGQGVAFFELAKQHELEGIVAKRKDSIYKLDTRTKDWIKVKHLIDDDFVVCGYIEKENNMISIVLGQYDNGKMIYMGHATLGISRADFAEIRKAPKISKPLFDPPPGNENAVWVEPVLVCTVKYMPRIGTTSMQQPVFKGLRNDKLPQECMKKD